MEPSIQCDAAPRGTVKHTIPEPDPWKLDGIRPLSTFVLMDKPQLAYSIQSLFSTLYAQDKAAFERGAAIGGMCLHWTYAACMVLRLSGRRALMQAGSMSWPVNLKAKPTEATHFSYIWSPNDLRSQERIRSNMLPEVHVWVGLPDTGEVIDFSTHEFKTLAEGKHGVKWTEPDPPPYVWEDGRRLVEAGIYYAADLEPIRWVRAFLNRSK